MQKKFNSAATPLLRELFQFIDASGLTDTEIASRAGTSLQFVSNLRRGVKTNPSLFNIECLANAVGKRITFGDL